MVASEAREAGTRTSADYRGTALHLAATHPLVGAARSLASRVARGLLASHAARSTSRLSTLTVAPLPTPYAFSKRSCAARWARACCGVPLLRAPLLASFWGAHARVRSAVRARAPAQRGPAPLSWSCAVMPSARAPAPLWSTATAAPCARDNRARRGGVLAHQPCALAAHLPATAVAATSLRCAVLSCCKACARGGVRCGLGLTRPASLAARRLRRRLVHAARADWLRALRCDRARVAGCVAGVQTRRSSH